MQRAWCRWQVDVNNSRLQVAFGLWRRATYHNQRLANLVQALFVRHKARVLFEMWIGWRRKAGASKMGRLLHAWTIIGPARRALRTLRRLALQASLTNRQRYRRLRSGMLNGFVRYVENRLYVANAITLAKEHHRKRNMQQGVTTLRHHLAANIQHTQATKIMAHMHRKMSLQVCMDRWLSWHHDVVLMGISTSHADGTRRRKALKSWVRYTVLSKSSTRFIRARVQQSMTQHLQRWAQCAALSRHTAAFARSIRLKRALKRWHVRTCTLPLQRKSQHTASAFRRREILAQGLMWLSYVTRTNAQARSAVRTKNHRRKAAAILLWREVLEAFHHVRKAHKSIITGRLTLAFSLWRKSGRIFKREHSRSRMTDQHWRRQVLAAAVSLWHMRIAHALRSRATSAFVQRRTQLRHGLSGLRRWTHRRRIARLIVWRAGFWAGTVRMSSALQAWQRAANRERSIKTCFIIARGRRDASCSNVTHYQGRILKRRLFTILRSYVLTTTLARRTLTAWSRHSQLSSQLRRQAQHICLRVGLRALLTWAKVSKQRRVGRHRAFTHAMLRLKRVALEAWESVVYPMGRPRSVPSRICKEEDKLTEWGEKQLPTGAASEQTVGCLETAMVKAVEIRSLQYPPNSLRTLRLPMVRTLLRRVLRSWGKNAAKEKRIRYIEKMLQGHSQEVLPSRLDVDSYHQEVGGKIAGISGNIVIPQRRLSCSDPHSHHASTKLVKTPPSSCSRLSGYECLMRSPTNRRTIIGSPTCTKRTAACTTNLPNLRRRLEQGGAKFCEGYLVDPALADEKGFERGSYLRSHLLNLASK